MEWTPGGVNSDVEDRRGESGGGGGLPFGGGGLGIVGVLVVVVLSLVTGRNLLPLLGGGSVGGGPVARQSSSVAPAGPVSQSADEKRSFELMSYTLGDVQNTWTRLLPEQENHSYRHARLVIFRGSTSSGCGGSADAATGPFYCPADERVYMDLGFWNELTQLGGDNADFAQAYVLAHELGHHVQNILGTERKAQQLMRDPGQRSRASVELELQADCYAGVWASTQQARKKIDANDVREALKAAAAVGDDHIQKMQRGTVSPETWTHGSSAEREGWFTRGLTSGQAPACNTFEAGPDGYQRQ